MSLDGGGFRGAPATAGGDGGDGDGVDDGENVEREVDERRGVGDRDVDGKGARIARGRALARAFGFCASTGSFSGDESALERRDARGARGGRDGFWACSRR